MSDTQKSPAQIIAEKEYPYYTEISEQFLNLYIDSMREIFIKGWNAKPSLSQEEIEAIKQKSWNNGFAHGLKEGGIDVNTPKLGT